jgi:hypothetical protein
MYELAVVVLVLFLLTFVVKFSKYIILALILGTCLYIVFVVGDEAGTISELGRDAQHELLGGDDDRQGGKP